MINVFLEAFAGPVHARNAHRQALSRGPGIGAGVRELMARCPADASSDPESPIFLLSAGWRSGSTLLQRLLMSDPRVLIWGEPYDECGLLQALASTSKAFRPDWPPAEYFYDGRPSGQLTGEWIANLFPALSDWRPSLRALLETLFAQPARRVGSPRWGVKEVRLTAEHALFLKWLYPRAKFLLLYRHPLDAYRSYSGYGRSWYDTFPDRPMLTPTLFGAHWQKLMQGYLDTAQELEAMLVRYEDLISGALAPAEIGRYLELSIDRSVLERKVGGVDGGSRNMRVNRLEQWLLRRKVITLTRRLGYEW